MIFHKIHSQKPKTFGILFSEVFSKIKSSMPANVSILKFSSSQKELPRRRLFINHLKKSLVFLNHKKVIMAKRQKMLDLRRQEFENYRIDYLPLGWESDFE